MIYSRTSTTTSRALPRRYNLRTRPPHPRRARAATTSCGSPIHAGHAPSSVAYHPADLRLHSCVGVYKSNPVFSVGIWKLGVGIYQAFGEQLHGIEDKFSSPIPVRQGAAGRLLCPRRDAPFDCRKCLCDCLDTDIIIFLLVELRLNCLILQNLH